MGPGLSSQLMPLIVYPAFGDISLASEAPVSTSATEPIPCASGAAGAPERSL